jgi:hypothetical protein
MINEEYERLRKQREMTTRELHRYRKEDTRRNAALADHADRVWAALPKHRQEKLIRLGNIVISRMWDRRVARMGGER